MASSDSDSENARCAKKKVKERKEKKKKDKVTEVSDHAEPQPQIVQVARKKRKTKDPETPVETKPVSPHSEGEGRKKRKRDRESEEPPSDVKKEKKKLKKEKTPGTAYDPATDSLLYVPDASGAAGTVAIVPETTEKQKKKNKTSGHWASSVIEPTPSGGAADKLEQSRKRKPTNGDAVEANGDEGSSKKSRSKSKKRKKGETVEDERHPSTPVPEGDHSSRKRKKSKASVHPDPSDDPNLTEQSQKALIYVYSQFTSPETWKFNKARQNWVIRNVWTPKVPEKHVPMVVEYLSKVEGRVRETLVESCNKVISGSNPGPATTQAGTDEKGSENPKPPTTTITRDEITQRAYTLLYALTKKP